MLKDWLSLKTTHFIGVDISNSGIRLVELSGNLNQVTIDNIVVEPLEKGVFVESEIKEADLLLQALKRVRAQVKHKHAKVAIAVPGSAVSTKLIQVDKSLSNIEQEAIVFLEGEKYFSDNGQQFSMDYCVLGDAEANPDCYEILIAATRAETMSLLVELLAASGFKTQIVNIDYFAIARACEYLYPDYFTKEKNSSVAIVDIGLSKLSFFVTRQEIVVYSREIGFDHGYGVTETMLTEADTDMVSAHDSLLTEDALSHHINRALQFFYSVNEFEDVDHLILTGHHLLSPHITQHIEQTLKIPTNVVDLSAFMANKMTTQEASARSSEIACGFGLALHGMARQ